MKNTSTRKQPATKATVPRAIVQGKGLHSLSARRSLQGSHSSLTIKYPTFPASSSCIYEPQN